MRRCRPRGNQDVATEDSEEKQTGGEPSGILKGAASTEAQETETGQEKGKEALMDIQEHQSSVELVVHGLNPNTSVAGLKTLFSQHGRVLSLEVCLDEKRPDLCCFGVVTMSTSKEADKCVRMLHCTRVQGHIISVQLTAGEPSGIIKGAASTEAQETETGQEKGKEGDKCKELLSGNRQLWITGIMNGTSARDLRALFSSYGTVQSAEVFLNASSPWAACYGLVTIATVEEAVTCVKHLNLARFRGCTMRVEMADQEIKGNTTSSAFLWISGISQRTRAASMKALLSKFGVVMQLSIVVDVHNPENRYTIAKMESAEQAQKCVLCMNKMFFLGGTISVSLMAEKSRMMTEEIKCKIIVKPDSCKPRAVSSGDLDPISLPGPSGLQGPVQEDSAIEDPEVEQLTSQSKRQQDVIHVKNSDLYNSYMEVKKFVNVDEPDIFFEYSRKEWKLCVTNWKLHMKEIVEKFRK